MLPGTSREVPPRSRWDEVQCWVQFVTQQSVGDSICCFPLKSCGLQRGGSTAHSSAAAEGGTCITRDVGTPGFMHLRY